MLNGAINVVRRITWTVDDRQGLRSSESLLWTRIEPFVVAIFSTFRIQLAFQKISGEFPINVFSVCSTGLLTTEGFEGAVSRDVSTQVAILTDRQTHRRLTGVNLRVSERYLFDSLPETTIELCVRSPTVER